MRSRRWNCRMETTTHTAKERNSVIIMVEICVAMQVPFVGVGTQLLSAAAALAAEIRTSPAGAAGIAGDHHEGPGLVSATGATESGFGSAGGGVTNAARGTASLGVARGGGSAGPAVWCEPDGFVGELGTQVGRATGRPRAKNFFSWLNAETAIPTHETIRGWMQRVGLGQTFHGEKGIDLAVALGKACFSAEVNFRMWPERWPTRGVAPLCSSR